MTVAEGMPSDSGDSQRLGGRLQLPPQEIMAAQGPTRTRMEDKVIRERLTRAQSRQSGAGSLSHGNNSSTRLKLWGVKMAFVEGF